jgi:hypothetical protein
MAVHSPTSTNYPNGVVEIFSLVDFTYEQILQSLANEKYLIHAIYIQTQTSEQLLQLLSFNVFDVNGNAIKKDTVPTIDPSQYQNSLVLEFKDEKYVIDGRAFIRYNVLGDGVINFYVVTETFGSEDLLPKDKFFEHFSNKISM